MTEDGAGRLRVVHVINGLDAGGAEQMLTRIALAARDRGVDQTVISLMGEGIFGGRIRAAGITVHSLNMRPGWPNPAKVIRLAGLLRRAQPTVVMTWLYHADLLGLLAAMAAGVSPKRVVWNLRCSNIHMALYRRSTTHVVRALRRLSGLPGAVATNSEAGRQHHMALGYRPRAWVYLPNGVDLALWRPNASDRKRVRADLGIAETDLVIGMVARVDPQKDHYTFLTAAALIAAQRPDARFVLVGTGTETLCTPDPLRRRLLALGFRSDVPELMRALDVHVLSSAFGEGFPNVVIEAMASGVPCVVTDVGDASQLVTDVGRTAAPGDAVGLSQAILEVMATLEKGDPSVSERARDFVAQRFALEEVVARYHDCWTRAHRSASGADQQVGFDSPD